MRANHVKMHLRKTLSRPCVHKIEEKVHYFLQKEWISIKCNLFAPSRPICTSNNYIAVTLSSALFVASQLGFSLHFYYCV